jgi:hypothetical protein
MVFLSVPQFAAREGVSRIRVLQLLAQGRITGANKIGHRWAIPVSSRIARRKPGRPRRMGAGAGERLLRRFARRYVWWLSPDEALRRPGLVASQVMEMGDYEDARALEAALGREALTAVLRNAEPGRFSEAAWAFWHYRLGLARPGRVPELPLRRIP